MVPQVIEGDTQIRTILHIVCEPCSGAQTTEQQVEYLNSVLQEGVNLAQQGTIVTQLFGEEAGYRPQAIKDLLYAIQRVVNNNITRNFCSDN